MKARTLLTTASLLTLATSFSSVSISVQAADLAPAPVYYKSPPIAPFNPWMIRLRVLGVLPDSAGGSVSVAGAPPLSSPSSGLSISDRVIPELDITYFFTKNIAAELILGVASHHISGSGTLNGLDVGKAWLLPPTLTLQYHFTDSGRSSLYRRGHQLHRILQPISSQYAARGACGGGCTHQQPVWRRGPIRLRLHA